MTSLSCFQEPSMKVIRSPQDLGSDDKKAVPLENKGLEVAERRERESSLEILVEEAM